jgi:hypothetical protein
MLPYDKLTVKINIVTTQRRNMIIDQKIQA